MQGRGVEMRPIVNKQRSHWIASTPAGFVATREALGLDAEWLAGAWGVSAMAIASWEAGLEEIPDNLPWQLERLAADFEDAVDAAVKVASAHTGGVAMTYQFDEDSLFACGFPARWHRAVARHAALRAGTKLEYIRDASASGRGGKGDVS
jgi:hypothetical protein